MPVSQARLDLRLAAVLAALEQASTEYDAWLRSLDRLFGDEEAHPFMGKGARSGDVAEVLVAGQTHFEATAAAKRALGITSWHGDLHPFDHARRISDAVHAVQTYPSQSQCGQVVWALRQLAKRGLVAKDERGHWAITHAGDEKLRSAA